MDAAQPGLVSMYASTSRFAPIDVALSAWVAGVIMPALVHAAAKEMSRWSVLRTKPDGAWRPSIRAWLLDLNPDPWVTMLAVVMFVALVILVVCSPCQRSYIVLISGSWLAGAVTVSLILSAPVVEPRESGIIHAQVVQIESGVPRGRIWLGPPDGASWRGHCLIVDPHLPGIPHLDPGDTVVINGEWARATAPSNPNGFDTRRWFRTHRIGARLEAVQSLVVLRSGNDVSPVLKRVRIWLRDRIAQVFVDDGPRSLMQAMILGSRSALEADVQNQFRRLGLAHVLAVSGLHFAIVIALVRMLVLPFIRRLPLRPDVRRVLLSCVILILAFSFAWMVGWSASVFRAFVMMACWMVADMSFRRASLNRSLMLAFVVLIAIRPHELFSIGFHLSFAALGGITSGLQFVDRMNPGGTWWTFIGLPFWVSLSASIGTAIPLLIHFNALPLIGLLISPAVVLVVSALLMCSMLLLVAHPLLTVFAPLMSSGWTLLLLAISCMQDAELWWSTMLPTLTRQHVFDVTLLTMAWMLLVWGWTRQSARQRFRVGIILVAIASCSLAQESRPSINFTFLDVDQGDAMIIESSASPPWIVDTGPGRGAARTIIRALDSGMSQSGSDPTITLTHGDMDHRGGLAALMEIYPEADVTSAFRLALQNHTTVLAGKPARTFGDARVYFLHPVHSGSDNASSLVMMIQYGFQRVLLTGDIGKREEHLLMNRFPQLLDVDVLKVAHHGSDTSSSDRFLQSASPSIAVISAGPENRFGHPHLNVLSRLMAAETRIHTTAESGALRIRLDGRRIWMRSTR